MNILPSGAEPLMVNVRQTGGSPEVIRVQLSQTAIGHRCVQARTSVTDPAFTQDRLEGLIIVGRTQPFCLRRSNTPGRHHAVKLLKYAFGSHPWPVTAAFDVVHHHTVALHTP